MAWVQKAARGMEDATMIQRVTNEMMMEMVNPASGLDSASPRRMRMWETAKPNDAISA